MSSRRNPAHRHSSGYILSTVAVAAWLLLVAGLLAGCSGGAQQETHGDTEAAGVAPAKLTPEQCLAGGEIQQAAAPSDREGYLIEPGDVLAIDFYLSPEFNDEVTVRPDGKVTLRLVGDLQAAGLTPAQFATSLDRAYNSELRSPDAAVHVKNMPDRLVYVQGQVSKPGSFPLMPGMTALQAVSDAGGLTEDASDDAVLIRRDVCGQPHGIKIDVSNAEGSTSKGESDVALMPRDIVVVPRSKIANVDLFVKHYLQELLPFPPYLSLPAM